MYHSDLKKKILFNINVIFRYVEYSPYNNGNVHDDIHYRAILVSELNLLGFLPTYIFNFTNYYFITLQKIVEKFHRNESIPPIKDIATREFDFVDEEIRLTYHFSKGEYTQARRIFEKPPVTERGERLNFQLEMTTFYNVCLLFHY